MKLKKYRMFLIIAVFVIISACSKNTDPKRFEKIVTSSSWRVAKAEINDKNKTGDFNNYIFRFEGNKDLIIIKPDIDTLKGAWTRGNDKKPLLFYMIIPQIYPNFITFDDDWVVTYLTKDEFRIERNGGTADEFIFRKKV
jgi:hypothetical protein